MKEKLKQMYEMLSKNDVSSDSIEFIKERIDDCLDSQDEKVERNEESILFFVQGILVGLVSGELLSESVEDKILSMFFDEDEEDEDEDFEDDDDFDEEDEDD